MENTIVSPALEEKVNELNSNLSKHYVQIASQSGSTLADSVKATLNQYPHFLSLSTGDTVAIAGGWLGVRTYTINFTKEDTYKFVGTVYDNVNTYSFVYNNQQNSLTMEQIALNSRIDTVELTNWYTAQENVTFNSAYCHATKSSNVVTIQVDLTVTGSLSGNPPKIADLSEACKPKFNMYPTGFDSTTNSPVGLYLGTNGSLCIYGATTHNYSIVLTYTTK